MENRVDNGESSRRRFIRKLTTVGAAGGIAALLYGRVTEKPLIQIAQAASGGTLSIDAVNDGESGITELHSTVVGDPGATSGYAYGVFLGYDTATSGYAYGLMGVSDSTTGRGVRGWATAGSGETVGVHGRVDSPGGYAIVGYSSATSADPGMAPTGVSGQVMANGGSLEAGPWPTGVEGYAGGTSGLTMGVFGHTGYTGSPGSPDGTGVVGIAYATTGHATGIYGRSDSPDGIGVSGYASATSGVEPGSSPKGVYGEAHPCGGSWDIGPWPRAVEGLASGTSGVASGVYGQADSPDADGVTGIAWAPGGVTYGVYGESESTAGTGVGGRANGDGGIGVLGRAGGAGAIPIVARAASGQTAPLQEWVNDNLTPLAVVDAAGQFGIGIATPVRQVHIRGNNAVARLDRNVDSASFIFVRTNTDYSQVWKSFTFGVKATGVDTGSFFIGDMHTNVSGSSDNRILIDTNGNVGIGTTTPSSKLHVAGRVKAQGYDTGDITFANGVQATEEGEGLAFMNRQGTKIALLDAQGNFYVRGKVIEGLPR